MRAIISKLLESSEPSIRQKILTRVLGRKPDSAEVRRLREEIRASTQVKRLLSERQADGKIPGHPYSKWCGAHWILATLAELGYPPGDESLTPLREQVCAWLLSAEHETSKVTIAGRVRMHASMEGNALWALLTLGLADARADELARRLEQTQWPDGGWNCDKTPSATNSSFMESILPLRALSLHARLTGNRSSKQAAERAAEVFLKRAMFRREHGGRIMRPEFVKLHYPPYWHYDILFGLKVMAEAGWVKDKRCAEALDLLESKQLPDGGYPAEAQYFRTAPSSRSGRSLVDWGKANVNGTNEFVTADALFVLKEAGRV